MTNLKKTKAQSSLPPKVVHVQEALQSLDVNYEVLQLQESTRTAREASEALGCAIGQIVKSIVFCAGSQPILVLVSGSNRVNGTRLTKITGQPLKVASPDLYYSIQVSQLAG